MKRLLLFLLICLALLFSATPTPQNPAHLYATELSDDLTQQHVDAIRHAEKNVLLFIFSLTDRHIIHALNQKSTQGVPVHVITDPKASPDARALLSPSITLTPRYFSGLMHLKILITDDTHVLLGSANMTPSSLKKHGNLVLSIEHPELAHAIQQKAHNQPVPHQTFYLADQSLELWFLPENKEASKRILQLISSAQKTIRVAMYTWTRLDFADALLAAQKRGVDVQVALDVQSSHNFSKKIAAYLKRHALPTRFRSRPGLLHHKFMYIDGKTLVLGSANWTKAAFKTNEDCFIILSPLTDAQCTRMDLLWESL